MDTAPPDGIMTRSALPVIIPAHGHGSRMRPVTGGAPKTLTPVNGQPILGRLLAATCQAGRPAVIYAQKPARRIEEYLAGLPGSQACVRYRYPAGYLPDMAAIFDQDGDELTVLDGDMVVPHGELRAFLATTLDTTADLLVGQTADPPFRDPRSIRLVPAAEGRFRIAPPQEQHLPRTIGAYHWRPRAVAAVRAYLRDSPRTFHEFIAHLADNSKVRVETFRFPSGINVNTPAERDIAEAAAARWQQQDVTGNRTGPCPR
jgi:molybdopterin-guanine dinucleotide biosynthesis protein A